VETLHARIIVEINVRYVASIPTGKTISADISSLESISNQGQIIFPMLTLPVTALVA
jgi:predicted thioesterase